MPLYGPFTVMTHNADGTLTEVPAAGVHFTADRPTFAAHEALLTPYIADHTWPLQFVMAGYEDDPGNTVPIVFADQATADTVIAQLTS